MRKLYEVYILHGGELEGLRFEHYEDAKEIISLEGEINFGYQIEKFYEVKEDWR